MAGVLCVLCVAFCLIVLRVCLVGRPEEKLFGGAASEGLFGGTASEGLFGGIAFRGDACWGQLKRGGSVGRP